MADTPRGETRSNWMWLLLVAAVILAGVIWYSATHRGEDIGGQISMHETTAAPADSAMGPSEAVPEQARKPQ